MNKNGDAITAEQIANFSMRHAGVCYRNSSLNPASAEETQAIMAAKDLLVDKNGNYVGDDRAIFGNFISADNDTRAPSAFIREQNRIIGEAADGLAEHSPDKGHVMKCNNNALFKLRGEDKSLSGNHALTNLRIKSLTSDVKAVVDDYQQNGFCNDVARKACLDQMLAIVPHHCGDHDKCTNEKWCKYLVVKNEYPDLDERKIAEEAMARSHRPFGGKNMSLSHEGIETLTNKIRQRFNAKSIDRIARGGCSNLSESFWNMNTKFSEGKRLNEDHTDSYVVTNKLTFCRIGDGNIEKTHYQVSNRLGLPITSTERKHQTAAAKTRKRIKEYQSSPEFKNVRSLSKMSKDHRMGKIDAKKVHRSGKVPLDESATCCVDTKTKAKARKSPICSICKQGGHTKAKYKMPPECKRPAIDFANLDLDYLELTDEYGIKAPKRRKILDLVNEYDWI